jgi:tocopherol O-methyltransferase
MKTLRDKIREHYDLASPFYRELWGQHIHHGLFTTGRETVAEATDKLVEFLAERCGAAVGARLLDVGCGLGGSAIWLSQKRGCKVTGINLSPVQIAMAEESARDLENKPRFLLADANELSIEGRFDIIWAIESLSHLDRRDNFFSRASDLLVRGGRICIADWLKDDNLSGPDRESYIRPIEEGMLVLLPDLSEYKRHIDASHLRLLYYEDLSAKVARTWDISSKLIVNRSLWRLAHERGVEFVRFLKSFKAMRRGFKVGALRYAAMVIEKPKGR